MPPGLLVRPPDDAFEREADRIAARAVASEIPARPLLPSSAPRRSEMLPSSPGGPLPPELRARVEPLLGTSLGHVRVHNDPDAHALAANLSARAFTHDSHIYLGAQGDGRDARLLAHEAAHVVQQQGAARGSIQRQFFWAHTQHPNQPAYPRTPYIPAEVVELKGASTFSPSPNLAAELWAAGDNALVRARFGTLASGVLRVRAIALPTMRAPGASGPPALTYQTASDDEFLELHHPAFPGGGFDYPPRLRVRIDAGVVTGAISFFPGSGRVAAIGPGWLAGYKLETLLGWRGLRAVTPGGVRNELSDGVLRFELTDLTFHLDDTTDLGGLRFEGDDSLRGTGSFHVVDDSESFQASASIECTGITAGAMPLRKSAGRISGSASFAVNLAPRDAFGGTFSGSIEGGFAGGMLTLQGTARYRSRRASGSVTLLLAPRALAWTRVSQRLAPGTANAPSITFGAATAPGYVLVGWGSVDFALNEWLTGSVSAVLDPDGYITSHGILRPTREFPFLTDRERWSASRQLGPTLEGSVTLLPVAGFFDIGGHATAALFAEGRVGPGRVYDLEVEGSFSTRPGSVLEARASGRINLSAWGRLRAELGGGLHFSVAGDIVRLGSVDIEGTATATVRTYVELQPTFAREADPARPDEAVFRISGELVAAGAADLGLSGRIVIRVAGARVWTVNLGSYQWNLGSLGMRASFSHVIGSHAPIELGFESAEFDDARFGSVIENLTNRIGERNDRNHDASLDQEAATRPADRPDTPTVLERRFTMNGAPHRLWVEHDPEAVIKMASPQEDRLQDKLEAEAAVVEQAGQAETGDAAAELQDEAAAARRLLAQTRAVEHALADLQSEARDTGEVAGFQEVADGLTSYGSQFAKTDLAAPAPLPPSDVEIADGRYVITTRAQLDAVRAIQPQVDHPPQDLDPDLEDYWQSYAGRYFPERLREIDRDLSRSATTGRDGPQIWEAYVTARRRFDPLRAAKNFQPELRDLVIADHPGIDPRRVEIDVGVRATRRGVRRTTRFADVVVTDVANDNIEVYSAKVHDVRTASVGRSDVEVRRWISDAMSGDVDEAAQNYGYGLEFRRPREADARGRLGASGSARHPLFEHRVYVSEVHLVWQYTSNLIPGRFIDDILDQGVHFGVRQRRRSNVQVDFQLRPEPPSNPPP